MRQEYKVLFEEIKIGNVQIKNRFVMAPLGPGGLCDADGSYNEQGVGYYVERAKGGTGLLITGVTMVENDIEKCSLPSMPCPTLNPINFVKTGKILTERVHAYNAKIFLQLSAGFGRVGIPFIAGENAVSASKIPHRWREGAICRELSISEIKTYVDKFAESALIAQKAGFDGIEIHAVHEGYLLDQFAIAFFNNRADEYGGSLKNRLRFAIEIVQAIKNACGNDFPVALRYSLKSFIKDWKEGGLPGEKFIEKGRDIEEGLEAAKILEEAGYDAFDVDVGSYDSWYWAHPPMYQEKGLYLPYSKLLKQILKVPIITAGRMDDPDLAAMAIRENMTDMVGLGRPLLADAEIPNKIMLDRVDMVRPCLSCQEGCLGRLAKYAAISCAVNPVCGREEKYGIKSADVIKKILIVGGGVAGCEAARVCALRGHEVFLYEKNDVLGGHLLSGGAPNFKSDDIALAEWYSTMLKALNVKVYLNVKISEKMLEESDFDTVILATGSDPKTLNIKNIDNVCYADEVLLKKKDPGKSTIIVGGGTVGCELALWLSNKGIKVTIVEQLGDILKQNAPLCHANKDMLSALIKSKQIDVKVNATIKGGSRNEVILQVGKKEEKLKTDSVIVAIGYSSQKDLYNKIKLAYPEVYLLGDAKQVQNIMYAIWDAYEVCRNI